MLVEKDINKRLKVICKIMRVVDVKISRFPDMIRGLVLGEGSQWLAMAENVVDYVIDGYVFINKVYIKQIIEFPHDTIEYGILSLKCPSPLTPRLDSYLELIEYLKDADLLIAVGLHDQKSILVGRVINVREKSFVLHPIDTNIQELSCMEINCEKIRYISVNSDYLSSISNYMKQDLN